MLRIYPNTILLPHNVSYVIFLRATVKKMTLGFVLPLGSLTLAKTLSCYCACQKSAGDVFSVGDMLSLRLSDSVSIALKKHTMRFLANATTESG